MAGGEWTVCALAEGIYRVILRRDARQRESMLTRYGIVQTDLGAVEAARLENGLSVGESRVELEEGRAVFHSRGYSLCLLYTSRGLRRKATAILASPQRGCEKTAKVLSQPLSQLR